MIRCVGLPVILVRVDSIIILYFQILSVLDAMGLHQYKESFIRESIDGAILLELDEEVLGSELGIKSKIHCVKLIKLISGEYSIRKFLPH